MINVTENAKEELKRISTEAVDQPESKLRLVASQEGQLGLIVDSEREGDQLVEHQGSTVLVVGQELSAALEGIGIDCQDTDGGPRLVLVRGNPEESTGQD